MFKRRNEPDSRYYRKLTIYCMLVAPLWLFVGVILAFVFDTKMNMPSGLMITFLTVHLLLTFYFFPAIYFNLALFCTKPVKATIIDCEHRFESDGYSDYMPSGSSETIYLDLEYVYRKRKYRRLIKTFDAQKIGRKMKDTLDIRVCPLCPKIIRIPSKAIDELYEDK